MDPLALWALIISGLSLIVALAAGHVAYLDYHQVGREEPWKLTKLKDEIWLLERVSRRPATISGYDVSTLCDVLEIGWLNPAAHPAKVFRRGTQELIQVKTESIGVHLELYSKEYRFRVPKFNRTYQASIRGQSLGGLKTWSTALY